MLNDAKEDSKGNHSPSHPSPAGPRKLHGQNYLYFLFTKFTNKESVLKNGK